MFRSGVKVTQAFVEVYDSTIYVAFGYRGVGLLELPKTFRNIHRYPMQLIVHTHVSFSSVKF
jgi:hypothetical protein